MKKLQTAIVAIGALATISMASVETPSYNISINPGGLIVGNLNVKAEFFNAAEYLGGIVPAIEGSYWSLSSGGADYKAYGLGVSGRWYKKGIKGLFIQGGIQFGSLSVDVTYGGSGSSTLLGAYGIGGYRWALGDEERFTIDLGLGVGLYSGSVKINGVEYGELSGFLPTGILYLGYSF